MPLPAQPRVVGSSRNALLGRQAAQAAARPPAARRRASTAGAAGIARGARPGPARRALGRRPGRDHDLLDRRRPLRLHVALGPAAVGRGAGRLPRARRATRARHGTGPGLARPLLVRHAHGGGGGRDARGCEPGHDLRRVCGRRGRPRARGDQPVPLRPGSRGSGRIRRPARQLPSRRARAAAALGGVHHLRRRRLSGPPGLGRGRPRPGRPARPAHPRRADRHDRHRRNHPRALGTCLHPVLRGGQAPDADRPALRADRRRLGCRADGHHRRLRADRVRRDAARDRSPRHHRRTRCRSRVEAARRPSGLDLVRSRPRRRCAARGRRRPALDRLLGLGGVRPRVPARRLLRRGAVLLSHLSRRSRPGRRGSSSSPACRWSRCSS